MSLDLPKAICVLVVDDDEMLNHLICNFLNFKGMQTLAAHNLAEAIKIADADRNVDLILLDYQLGDGVGIDLLTSSAYTSYIEKPPVIMISANEEPQFLEQCFSAGVDDYIIKPVNLSLLALKIATLIKSVNMQKLIKCQYEELERFKAEAEREEQIAKFTYEYLLRQNSPKYPGVDVWVKSYAAFSGDVILVKHAPDGKLYCMLADATGHGLSAAITIMPIITIFNAMVAKSFPLPKMVAEINRKLVENTPIDRFVAANIMEINPRARTLSVWNGGMPPVCWIHDGKIIHRFHSEHMALGILEEPLFDDGVATVDLPPEGFIFACSDGLTEQENNARQCYSFASIEREIEARPDNLLEALARSLMRYVGKETYADDVSACVIYPSQVFDSIDVCL